MTPPTQRETREQERSSQELSAWCEHCNTRVLATPQRGCVFCGNPLKGLPPEVPPVRLEVIDGGEAAASSRNGRKHAVQGSEGPVPEMLYMGDGFYLPLDAVTQSLAILAVRGAGKSNAAAVLAEEFFDEGIAFVVIDPKGDWWGVRQAASGGKGLDILILGGKNGDHPLSYTSGRQVARMIFERNLTCVLDVSHMDTEEELPEFMTAFGEEMYTLHYNGENVVRHIILEEAHEVVPESAKREQRPMLNAWKRIVLLGRKYGLGSTLVSQRSAHVANSVLSQTGCMIALRTTSEDDSKKIQGWMKFHPDAKKIVAELPLLKDGEAWIVAPAWLGEESVRKVHFRRRWTFDSGSTPQVPEDRRAQQLSDDDIADIGLELSGKRQSANRPDMKPEQGSGAIKRDWSEATPLRLSTGEARQAVLERLGEGPARRAELMQITGYSGSKLYPVLSGLREEQLIHLTGGRTCNARWVLGPILDEVATDKDIGELDADEALVASGDAVPATDIPEAGQALEVSGRLIGARQEAESILERVDALLETPEGGVTLLRARYIALLLSRIQQGDFSPELLDRFERVAGFTAE